ncbi:MAG: nidogen-like domain-containing protein [Pseudomonadota bacterium]
MDTRCTTCGAVYVGTPNADTVAVTWNNVGYFSGHSNLTNNFQLLLRNQGAGNFDIEFRYDRLQWTTGDASGGSGGFGGTPAQAGFDAGDLTNFFTLPGSRTAAVLDLDNTSNVSPDTPGLWSFAIRSGAVPGSTPDNPLMPVVVDEGFNFNFNVVLNQRRFIDPIIAIGYDYIINSGPNFISVTLPDIGDGIYNILGGALFDVILGTVDVSLNDTFTFASGGVNRFRVLGIETSAMLDPNNPTAFVTGLTFNGTGNVNLNMNPVTLNIPDPQNIPEPVTLSFLGAGLAGITFMRRQAQRKETFKLAA